MSRRITVPENEAVEGLYNLVNTLLASTNAKDVFPDFLRHLADFIDISRIALISFSPQQENDFVIESAIGLTRSQVSHIFHAVSKHIRSEYFENPHPAKDPPIENLSLPFMKSGKKMEAIILPLPVRHAQPHLLISSHDDNLFSRDEIKRYYRFLRLAVRNLAMAIDRDAMITRIQSDQDILLENAYHNQIFLDISKDLASTLDPYMVLHKAFNQFGRLIPYSSITVLMFDDLEDSYKFLVQPACHLTQSYLDSLITRISEIFRDFPAEKYFNTDAKIPVEIFSAAVNPGKTLKSFSQDLHLPIILTDRVAGLIHLANSGKKRYTARDLNITSQFTAIFITSIKNAMIHKKTERLAFTDPLSGLFNHRFFQETLRQELIRARRYKKPLSLMIIDIDFFKKFNDTYGHLIGDKVLIHVGKIFERSVRAKIDTVARYGGEEFAVLLPETPLEGALLFAERIRGAVESETLPYGEKNLAVTVSIGVACTCPTVCDKPSQLIQAADTALYTAKEAGRNRVKIYREENVCHG